MVGHKSGLNHCRCCLGFPLKQKVRFFVRGQAFWYMRWPPGLVLQECSECGYVDPTNRQGKVHHRGAVIATDAGIDVDAAKVILRRGLNELGITLMLAAEESPGNRIKNTPKEACLADEITCVSSEPGSNGSCCCLSGGPEQSNPGITQR